MRIKTIYIENFRGYKGRTYISIESLTAFVGKNDIGKSTILEALDVFFNEGKNIIKIDKNDVNINGSGDTFTIGVCFEDFPAKIIVDSTVETSLEKEFLLNEKGLLEVKKEFKNSKKIGTYIVANYPTVEELNNIHLLSIAELKTLLKSLNLEVSDNRKSSIIRRKIIDSVDDKELAVKEITIDKPGAKQIWDSLAEYMPLYELFQSDRKNLDQDDEVQSPMKLLIKEILKQDDIEEKLDSVFNEIKSKAEALTERTIEKISEMNSEIAKELKSEFDSPDWAKIFKFSIDTEEGISLNKRGSGVRRLILLNFFRAEAERRRTERKVATVIYAFEEPETSQHPHHQKLLIEAFKELASNEINQVILTTHSPSIAKMLDINSLRFLEKNEDKQTIVSSSSDDHPNILLEISKSLGILPNIEAFNLNKIKLAICVEGKNDIAFLKNLNKNVNKLNEIVDFESEDILFIPMGGSTLQFWVNEDYLGKLNLAQFHLYDSDIGSIKANKYKKYVDIINTREKSSAVETRMRELENYIPYSILENNYDGLSVNSIEDWGTTDVPELIAEYVYNSDSARARDWISLDDKKKKNKTGVVKNRINTELVLEVTEELLLEHGHLDEIIEWHNNIASLLYEEQVII